MQQIVHVCTLPGKCTHNQCFQGETHTSIFSAKRGVNRCTATSTIEQDVCRVSAQAHALPAGCSSKNS